MAQKCVHKSCGKAFTNFEEDCVYHPGPPIFHEGQKGWKCCKPRVLTFDEFLSIPPCTTGKHSTVDDSPLPDPSPEVDGKAPPVPTTKAVASITNDTPTPERVPLPPQPRAPSPPPPEPESESDDPSITIPPNITCRRRSCNATSPASPNTASREGEECVYHPGHPIFHEGSKGWTCCKRRVLEFDEFMRIEGCMRKSRHMFVGSGKKGRKGGKEEEEEKLEDVRHDYYQTPTTVHASFYLKKISKPTSTVSFASPTSLGLDLHTSDKKYYQTTIRLYGPIDTDKSTWKVMGSKIEFTLVKSDGASWPVLREDERRTGEILQIGKPGRA